MEQKAGSWPLYELLANHYAAALREPPSRPEFDLVEVADENAAIELLELVQTLCCQRFADDSQRAESNLDCIESIESIFDALRTYRQFRDWTARPSPDPIKKLMSCREQDRTAMFRSFMLDPDHKREILTRLWLGARTAGILEDRLDAEGWRAHIVNDGVPGPWLHGEDQWAFALAKEPRLFERAIAKSAKPKVKTLRGANLVRRLLSLAKAPTSKKFDNLLADARKADVDGLDAIGCALRFAARRTIYKGHHLPRDWLTQIKSNPRQIREVAKVAHAWLRRGLSGQGRVSNPDLERYAAQVAAAYLNLTGARIGYATATENSRNRARGESYGTGLKFMLCALKLIDGATTPNQARGQIDKLRK